MHFTENIKRKLINLLHTKPNFFKAGSSCLYLRLGEKLGAKLYKNKRLRNTALSNQTKLNKLKLSPKMGAKFEIPFLMYRDFNETGKRAEYEWVFYHGYLTQHAEKVDSRRDYRSINEFLKLMESLGYDTYDLENNWNVGKINNRIVCVDTESRTLAKKRK